MKRCPVHGSKALSDKRGNVGAFPLGTVEILKERFRGGGKIKECA